MDSWVTSVGLNLFTLGGMYVIFPDVDEKISCAYIHGPTREGYLVQYSTQPQGRYRVLSPATIEKAMLYASFNDMKASWEKVQNRDKGAKLYVLRPEEGQ